MARAVTTLDSFNAVGEAKRRRVLDILAGGDRPVNQLVAELGWPQPQVSKHLGVLKRVGLVHERREGRQRVYGIDGDKLKTIYDWVQTFERFWSHHLDRIKERAEHIACKEAQLPSSKPEETKS